MWDTDRVVTDSIKKPIFGRKCLFNIYVRYILHSHWLNSNRRLSKAVLIKDICKLQIVNLFIEFKHTHLEGIGISTYMSDTDRVVTDSIKKPIFGRKCLFNIYVRYILHSHWLNSNRRLSKAVLIKDICKIQLVNILIEFKHTHFESSAHQIYM